MDSPNNHGREDTENKPRDASYCKYSRLSTLLVRLPLFEDAIQALVYKM